MDLNNIIKIVLIGKSGVGKTNLLNRFNNGVFDPNSKRSTDIEHLHEQNAKIDNTEFSLDIFEMPGRQEFRPLESAYYQNAKGVILVYDITDSDSFNSLSKYIEEIQKYTDPTTKFMLIGNKSDTSEENRQVSMEEGEKFAHSHNFLFFETSALNDTNIFESFSELIFEIIKQQNAIEAKKLKINKNTKNVILSSSGIRNIVKEKENFTFIIGSHSITIDKIFAEFISPIVSHAHLSDPTIDTIDYNSLTNLEVNFDNYFTDELDDLFCKLASGISIDINLDQAQQLKYLSIFLGNQELFDLLNAMFPTEFDPKNIEPYIDQARLFYRFARFRDRFAISLFSALIEISRNFDLVDKSQLLKLNKLLIYYILSFDTFSCQDEDSLYDFIIDYFNGVDDAENDELYDFLQFVDCRYLSDEKFYEFISNIEPSKMSNNLWKNICNRFFVEDDEYE